MNADEQYELYVAHTDACVWCAGDDPPRLCTVGRDLRASWMRAERVLPKTRRDNARTFLLPQAVLDRLEQLRASLPE
jgi:hypothetical protein